MNWNIYEHYWTCDQCQRIGNMLTPKLAKLVTTLLKKPFQKWGLDFIGLVKHVSRLWGNWYILIATDYVTKWVEAQAFLTKHYYSNFQVCIGTRSSKFGCPLTIVTNQCTLFINDSIRYFVDHFILWHTSSTIYYPQGNGQIEFTN